MTGISVAQLTIARAVAQSQHHYLRIATPGKREINRRPHHISDASLPDSQAETGVIERLERRLASAGVNRISGRTKEPCTLFTDDSSLSF